MYSTITNQIKHTVFAVKVIFGSNQYFPPCVLNSNCVVYVRLIFTSTLDLVDCMLNMFAMSHILSVGLWLGPNEHTKFILFIAATCTCTRGVKMCYNNPPVLVVMLVSYAYCRLA